MRLPTYLVMREVIVIELLEETRGDECRERFEGGVLVVDLRTGATQDTREFN